MYLSDNDLNKMFEAQLQTLKDLSVSKRTIELLEKERISVVHHASLIDFDDALIPFVPVIPNKFRSFYDLTTMLRNNTKEGYVYLNPEDIMDVIRVPNKPYYIFNIDSDGKNRCGGCRSYLTAAEILALCLHTSLLSRHFVWAGSSLWGEPWPYKCIPYVYIDERERPHLGFDVVEISTHRVYLPTRSVDVCESAL